LGMIRKSYPVEHHLVPAEDYWVIPWGEAKVE
jgi:hypothetical protein